MQKKILTHLPTLIEKKENAENMRKYLAREMGDFPKH